MALVPKLPLESGGFCDYDTWQGRGWCRAELWCAQFSKKGDFPMIVVHGAEDAEFMMSVQWIESPPDAGYFTIEKDRKAIRSFIKTSLESYTSHLKTLNTQLDLCRYLKARLGDWTGEADIPLSLESFLTHFGFQNLEEALKTKSIGALACACLSGNVPMISRLIEAKAKIGIRGRPLLKVDVLYWTPLQLAIQRGSRALPVIEELLQLRADPNTTDAIGLPALGLCRDLPSLECLIRHRADVNLSTGLSCITPLAFSSSKLAPVEVVERLLELQADVNPQRTHSRSPLSCVSVMGRASPEVGLQIASSLLHARADLNQLDNPGGFFRFLELSCRVVDRLRCGKSGAFVLHFAESSFSPLGFAAMAENGPLVSLLLEAQADPDRPNHRGHTPRQLATPRMRELIETEQQIATQSFDPPREYIPKVLKTLGSLNEFGASGARVRNSDPTCIDKGNAFCRE